jgi:hypothetical protein
MTITPTLALGGFQAAIAETPAILDDPRWRLLQPPWSDAAVRARAPTRRAGGVTEGQRTVLALHRAGARIIAGVDSPLTPYGTALHTELHDYVAAGGAVEADLRNADARSFCRSLRCAGAIPRR